MRNLSILFKNNFNMLVGKLFGKKQRPSKIVGVLLLILGLLAIVALYSLQAYTMFVGLGTLNLQKVCVFHAILTSLSVILIIGIMRSSANQKHSDSDFLLSLPLTKSQIIISKTLNKYLFDLFFAFLTFAPFLVLYLALTEFSLSLLLLGILYMLVAPLLSVGISYICDFVITRLFNRTKLGSLLKSFLIIFLFVVVMGLMLLKTSTYGSADFANLDAYFADRPVSNLILQFLFSPNILNILIVLLGAILPFLLGVVLYTLNYGKTFNAYSSNKKTLDFKGRKSSLNMLYKKELFSYASIPSYVINTVIGVIVMLVLAVFIAITGFDGISSLFGATLSKPLLCGLIAIVFSAMASTCCISAVSISLEGKNLWILKSSPINEKTLFLSKALVHLSIILPCVAVASVIVSIALKLDFLQFLMVLTIPALATLINAFAGILINLWLPLLDFEDEVKVIKQSMSVLLSMVLGILIAIVPFGIFKLFSTLSVTALFAISAGVYLLILMLILLLLFTLGVKLFRKL